MSHESELAFAKGVAQQAGAVMLQYFRTDELTTEWKSDNTPLTAADRMINSLVIDKVKEHFPEHGILGEEESFASNRELIWVVDPIDGTAPFSLGMPVSTFSLALVDRVDGQSVVAATYDPFLKELYSATKNGGAFLNDKPIKTSEKTDFSQAFFALTGTPIQNEHVTYRPGLMSEALRSKGAKTIGFASYVYTSNRVASGQLLGVMIGDAGPWDIAASSLIVEESGGLVTDIHGERRRFDEAGYGCIHAANATVLAQLVELSKLH